MHSNSTIEKSVNSLADSLVIRQLNTMDYSQVWHAMKDFTDNRDDTTADELWLVEHPAVFTQGQAGKAEHLLVPGDIEVVKVDRGGQVTYHGPGQLVVYVMINLRRKKIGVRQLVTLIENSIVSALTDYDIAAYAKADAPGVYVDEKKIASLGLRVRKGCSFHGLAMNVNMDLSPFLRINPCGYAGLEMVQTADLQGPKDTASASTALVKHLINLLKANNVSHQVGLPNENNKYHE
ncbi:MULTISPECIES: lipoyl(octanoyl) transferase LipB [Colwellia]|uniref:Octanoyltransferase n=1 Tax=Colwellia psychrerythraea (strain 34H / ATCC BAA-681) TaxID=167879 RepID=LIPB_COLP3|nr:MULTISPECIES: lipoyl(octanoyl) transferase LipB [Colwellia]Q484R7.1 RecName: Full=Octanoyltransferase; AltName: Full=Lipoate-protein ligase B; AltName: Full=Lipoyl/octanoyl transferase; AltName: Full=Octanoyl-[acyl-carrier-protein]-protein N-octanoyltransferase [Colwellia psychrerythraea 34H]AAZ27941.1 lipoate-protein ligase B [Colwellia psychrerythraea 34H]PKH89085.1 octanoyltransferase [Colwellia sp. Bg11-28]